MGQRVRRHALALVGDHARKPTYVFTARYRRPGGVTFRRKTEKDRKVCNPLGQRDLRRLLVTRAMAVVQHASRRGEITDPWLAGMLARKPKKVVAVALANRTARRVSALATKREAYRVRAAA